MGSAAPPCGLRHDSSRVLKFIGILLHLCPNCSLVLVIYSDFFCSCPPTRAFLKRTVIPNTTSLNRPRIICDSGVEEESPKASLSPNNNCGPQEVCPSVFRLFTSGRYYSSSSVFRFFVTACIREVLTLGIAFWSAFKARRSFISQLSNCSVRRA